MNKFMIIISFFFLLITHSGCTTVYKTVVDERNVKTIASDTTIKSKIVAKFIDDDTVKALDISASCYEGRVYLIGEYDTVKQKERAIEIAQNIEGVESVTNYLLPKNEDSTCGTKENLKITAKVKTKLVGDKNIWSTNVDVKTILNLPPFSGHTEKLNVKFMKEVCPCQREIESPTIMSLRERQFAW